MRTVTIDTNVMPADDLIGAVPPDEFAFSVVTVTERELGDWFERGESGVGRVLETAVWDHSTWDNAVWGGPSDASCLENVLSIIGEGSFPPPRARSALTAGQRRQLLDAMIFCAHVRERRDIFVTNDQRGFVRKQRREALERAYSTKVMTKDEFLAAFAKGKASDA